VTLARVLRPHGRRGEVAAEILTDFPERLARLTSVELWSGQGEPRRAVVRNCWLSKSRGRQAIFHFEECASISDAEKLVGLEVQVPLAARVALPAGSYFVTDLIDCAVFLRGGKRIGRVREVQSSGEGGIGTPNLIVDSPRGEVLIPLAQEICVVIDTDAQRIEAILPEGLLDLNIDS
jgi:16S rRNA processing protein RimM